jgi:transposase
MTDEKPLPEIVIDPIKPQKKKGERGQYARKGSGKTKKALNALAPLMGAGHRPNKANEIAFETEEVRIGKAMFLMMLDGKSERDISKHFDCSIDMVRKYLNIQLNHEQDGLMMLRGKHSIIAYQRLEAYVISPAIERIKSTLENGEFDQRAYDTLMRAIKLETEIVAPKGTVNVNNNGGNTFINSNSPLFMMAQDAMREEGEIDLDEVVIDAEDINLNEYRIPKVDEMIDDAN